MKNKINSRGLERKDDHELTDEAFENYRQELLDICPVDSEEKAAKYREILFRHLNIKTSKVGDSKTRKKYSRKSLANLKA